MADDREKRRALESACETFSKELADYRAGKGNYPSTAAIMRAMREAGQLTDNPPVICGPAPCRHYIDDDGTCMFCGLENLTLD